MISINNTELNKRPDESERGYIWRIGQLFDNGLLCKIDGSDVLWSDVTALLNSQLREEGIEYSESTYRKPYKCAVDYFNDVFKNMIEDWKYVDELELKQAELQKERYKYYDQRNAYNKMLRDRSRQEELNEIIAQTINEGNLKRLQYKPNLDIQHSNNTLLVSLNDLHIGANVRNAFNVYNSDICKERLCEYVDKIKIISELHKSKECVVWCNGDIINGNIHQSIAITNKENVVEQIMIASELLSEFLAEISNQQLFKRIRFVSVAGNHSRLGLKDDSLKDERLDNLIEWYMKARLQHFKNIDFDGYNKIDTTMYVVNIHGLNFVGTHGDYDNSISKIQAVQMMIKKDIYAVLMGHKHHNQTDSIQGVKTIMAGSFLGVDDYCITKRLYGKPEQMISIVDSNGIVCNYDVQFNK